MNIEQFYFRLYINMILPRIGCEVISAENEEDLDKVFNLRWRVYSESGYINPGAFPEKKFSDKYDPYSINFLALYKNEPVGAVRLVKNSSLGFPIESYYNINLENKDSAVEVSRFVVSKNLRGGSRKISLPLLKTAYEWSVKNNVLHWYQFMPEKLKKSFEKIGVDFKLLEEDPLLEKHKKARIPMEGYFRKTGAKPYRLDIKEITNLLK